MMYDERFIGPMRQEIAQLGVAELVDAGVGVDPGRGEIAMAVRFITNRSSGKMGYAVAEALREQQMARGEKPRYDGRWRPEPGKLIAALAEKLALPAESIVQYLDLVATAIAADIVPMVDENRILTYFGLQQVKEFVYFLTSRPLGRLINP